MLDFYYDTEYSEFVLRLEKFGWFLYVSYPPFGDLTHRIFEIPYPRLSLEIQTGNLSSLMSLEMGSLSIAFGRKSVFSNRK
jgi:hypothetical protein